MASLQTRKLCSTAGSCKQTAATNCEGCLQSFCTKHFIDHRNALSEEMNDIISEYNCLKSTFDQSAEPDSHPFFKDIDQWKEDSITKIQQKAQELRIELFQLIAIRKAEILEKLQQACEEIKNSQEIDNFIELDLLQWKTTLQNLKAKCDPTLAFSLEPRDDLPVVHNVSVIFTLDNELFGQVFDNAVQIQQNGEIAIHDASHNYTEIRGKNEYTTGRHRIRLCIDQSADSWTFLGINSKSTLLQKQSSSSKSAYGWTNNNYIWSNGGCQPNKSAARIEMKMNDMITLTFDCNHRKISMINERTQANYELLVNIDHCPFPWQFHVNLYEANSRIRILST
ncbi:unnamed protein product [Rotaria socialis]|uniref:B30.2/SPRY domain-containing protein n=1 Tax=Rotaria socialis TaxID=392032 RepID=A0A819A803_9BILA|nr:unnamed protein product [Rotaria socialis]CAF3367885.1 unnamed protein product [Rotaria socialis]CAF3552289.1 unnamed protein product [Rotaria socialis]CAF3783533.1 unnamed protein product [Rotaria socialis]CAF4349337.1 unnamed protein product [Rotaria socialis]